MHIQHTQRQIKKLFYIYKAEIGVDSEEDREMILAKVYELFSQDTEAYDDYDDIEGNDTYLYICTYYPMYNEYCTHEMY